MSRRFADSPRRVHPGAGAQRGAALLTAMIIVTLITTLAGAMLWQQWRAVQVEAAERSRSQSHWILSGAIDWSRLILSEDLKTGTVDHLGEPWAVPLAEAKLSTFLAQDKDNTDDAPEAFLSGSIVDAQSRYNLRNLTTISDPAELASEVKVLQRLLEYAGANAGSATAIVSALRAAAPPPTSPTAPVTPNSPTSPTTGDGKSQTISGTPSGSASLMPERVSQLTWLGIDAATANLLTPYLTILPERTLVNINTAPKEVLAAVIEGLDLSSAERIVQTRQRNPFKSVGDLQTQLSPSITTNANMARLVTGSSYFEVTGRLRLEDRVVEERALVLRRSPQLVVALRRERVVSVDPGGS